jgi:hypothetical protein
MNEWAEIVAFNWGRVTIHECGDVDPLDDSPTAEMSDEEMAAVLAFIAAAHRAGG